MFAWSPEHMPSIDVFIAMHSLDIDPQQKSIKQKKEEEILRDSKLLTMRGESFSRQIYFVKSNTRIG